MAEPSVTAWYCLTDKNVFQAENDPLLPVHHLIIRRTIGLMDKQLVHWL